MNNGLNTDVKSGFRTRYHITPIDSVTGLPTAETVTVCNMVLESGYLALGNPTAYTSISIGTNPTPPSPQQVGLQGVLASLNISESIFNQNIFESETGVISTIAHEFTFRDFTFPSNQRTFDICEIGLDGLTRAVFEPIPIDRSNWVHVIMEVIFEYVASPVQVINYNTFDDVIEGFPVDNLLISTHPIIFNQNPSNDKGRGWGASKSVLCYPWSGIEGDYGDKGLAATIGMTIIPTLIKDQYQWNFDISIKAVANTVIPGIIIRDTVNGGAFLIRLDSERTEAAFILPEDATLDLEANFVWKASSVNAPQ